MAEKIQKVIIFFIICLAVYLAYEIRGEIAVPQDREETGQEEAVTEAGEADGAERESAGQPLPARYDAREEGRAPGVKDQGNLGTCWAVTASSALEAALLPGERQVFSADHISMRNAYGKSLEEGGAYAMSISYLTGWLGPVAEEDDPYGDGVSPEGLAPIRHVQEVQLLQEKDLAAVKRLVYQCGAVQSSFYMDMEHSAHSCLL